MKDIGKQIKKYIKYNKYTQKTFAKKMNISESSLSKYLLNQRQIPIDTLYDFAKELNFSIDHLVGLSHNTDEIKLLTNKEKDLIILLHQLSDNKYDETLEAFLLILNNIAKKE